MDKIYIIISFIAGCLVGLPLAQYGWVQLKRLSERDGEKYCKEHDPLSKENFLIAFCHGVAWCVLSLVTGMNVLFLLYGLATSLIITLSIIDWLSYEIPPQFNVAILILGIVRLATDFSNWYIYLIGAFLVSGLFFLIALVSKGKAMGGGDIKLMFALGMLLGWKHILLVMFLGAALGSVIHIIIMKITKNPERMLSFGPYLSMGAYLTMLFGTQIIEWYVRSFFPDL